jgi:hypothetical protein
VSTPQKLKLVPGGACSACGASVFHGIYHKCGEDYRLGGPDGEVVEVVAEPLPAGAEGKLESAPIGPQNTPISTGPGHMAVAGGVQPAGDVQITPGGALPQPVQRQRHAEDFILRALDELRLDRQVLLGSEDGVKARVREIFRSRDSRYTDDVFDKAWKSLRALARDAADKGEPL